ncbi:MAG: hypothetical protein HRU20_32085 [Pseudomonadales bacterium]|nr:hypothetical protein [Pseudomonadales bacterium]
MLAEQGLKVGRYKVRSLMKEPGLVSKQPGAHRYKIAKEERPDIPNHLAKQFEAPAPNKVWCGDITYSVPGVQGKHGYLNEPQVYLEYINN